MTFLIFPSSLFRKLAGALAAHLASRENVLRTFALFLLLLSKRARRLIACAHANACSTLVQTMLRAAGAGTLHFSSKIAYASCKSRGHLGCGACFTRPVRLLTRKRAK
jgi:hypothetical protein